MQIAPFPDCEQERLAALREYGVLDTPGADAFDDLTIIAAKICGTPIALISLIDAERQWFLSKQGLDITETPRDLAFCAHAILGVDPLVVNDAHEDARFADNPLVTGGPMVRFYAGAPLITPSGSAVGTLCVIDQNPKSLDEGQRIALQALGRQVVAQLESRKTATKLRESEARFRSLASTLQAGIVVQNSTGEIVWSNESARALLGLTEDQLAGRSSMDPRWTVIHPDGSDFPGHTHPAMQALATGRPVHSVVMGVYRPTTNDRVWLQVDALPNFDANGQVMQAICTFADITELLAAQGAAREAWARTEAIVSSSSLAIITTDLHGTINTFNPAAERLLGYSADEMVDRHSPAVFHDLAEVVARAAELSAELHTPIEPGFEVFVAKTTRGLPNEHEWTYVRKDGTRVPVSLEVTAIRDAAGAESGYIGIAADITARREADAALIRAKDLAEGTARAKSDFLATMSHEIRTPMNGVLGMTNLLADTPLTTEQRGFTEAIERSAQLLMGVINDILDLSKVEAGKMSIEPIPFDIEMTVGEVAELLMPRAVEKGIELVIRIEPEVPRYLIGDAGRLRQVLLNLTGNSLKFTETGHVQVLVRAERGDGGMIARFEVSDTGIGIAPDALAGLFTPFTQADASTTRRFGGSGLGLSISKRIVELMGGTIGVHSVPGEGSTFWFTLPLPEDLARVTPVTPIASCEGVRALVVDDLAVNVDLVRALLSARGMRVSSASTGAAAVRGDAERAKDAGCHGYVTKPFRPSLLADMVGAVVARGPHWPADAPLITRHTMAESEERPGAVRAIPLLVTTDTPMRRILLAEDNAVNQLVASKMLEKMQCRVDLAADGAAALEMASKFSYDLIFMDVQMPEMDGLEATRRIRRLPHPIGATRIVAMTANALVGDREQCLDAGMDDFISKPVMPAALRDVLARNLGARAATDDRSPELRSVA